MSPLFSRRPHFLLLVLDWAVLCVVSVSVHRNLRLAALHFLVPPRFPRASHTTAGASK